MPSFPCCFVCLSLSLPLLFLQVSRPQIFMLHGSGPQTSPVSTISLPTLVPFLNNNLPILYYRFHVCILVFLFYSLYPFYFFFSFFTQLTFSRTVAPSKSGPAQSLSTVNRKFFFATVLTWGFRPPVSASVKHLETIFYYKRFWMELKKLDVVLTLTCLCAHHQVWLWEWWDSRSEQGFVPAGHPLR